MRFGADVFGGPGRAHPARLRVVVLFGAVLAGYALAMRAPGVGAPVWFSLACGFAAAVAPARGWACRVALVMTAVCACGGWFAWRVHHMPADSLARVLAHEYPAPATLLTLEGDVVTGPREFRPPREGLGAYSFAGVGWWFDVEVKRVEETEGWAGASGVLRVWVEGAERPGADAGSRVRITGMARPVAPPLNPGEPDARLWAAQSGRVGSMDVPDAGLVERIGPPATGAVVSWWRRARASLRARAERVVGPEPRTPERALVAALVLGERERTGVRESFTRLGLAHLMAISGFHLVVMAGAALFALRATGDRGWVEPVLLALLVAIYLVIVPARPPIVRAGAMVLALLAGEAFGRRYDRITLLGWIGVVMVIVRPMDVFALGFQLSFGLTGALMWIGGRVRRRLFGIRLRGVRRRRTWRTILRERVELFVAASLVAWSLALPSVAYRTGLVSPLGIVATAVVLPLIVVLLWVAYATLVVGVLIPPLAGMSGTLLDTLAGWTIDTVHALDRVPGSHFYAPPISAALAVSATLVVLYWLVRGRVRDRLGWALAAGVGVWIGIEAWVGPRPGALLRLDTLAVGNGTCHLIRSGSDAVLWDCGSTRVLSAGEQIARDLRGIGAWRVPIAIVTHANLDHYCGLPEVAGRVGLRRVVVGVSFLGAARDEPGGPEALVKRGLESMGVRFEPALAGDTLRIGHATLTFLSPVDPAAFAAENDRSLVGMIEVTTDAGPRRVLLCGDIQAPAMEVLEDATSRGNADLSADVLELPHHGSAHPAALKFVDLIDPEVVIQSTGVSRAGDVRWNSRRAGRDWCTTAIDGEITVLIHRDGEVEVRSFRD